MLNLLPPDSNYGKKDVGQNLVDDVSGFIDFATQFQDENSRDYTKSRDYNMPEYRGCKISDKSTSEKIIFNFSFSKYGDKLNFNIALPLFVNLPPKSLRVDTITDCAVADNNNETKKNNSSIFNIIYHPLSKLLVGILSVVNFLNLVVPVAVSSVIPLAIFNVSFVAKILGLVSSIAYAIPAVAYYLGNEIYRNKLDCLFSEIEEDIHNNRGEKASEKLKNLKFPFDIMLNSNFPDNRSLRRKYYNLCAKMPGTCASSAYDYYILALKFTDNAQDKLLPLIEIINGHERDLQSDLTRLQEEFHKGGYEQRCKDSVSETLLWQEPFIAQIPIDAPLYQELGAKIREEIGVCIDSLRKEEFDKATNQFYKIKWNDYHRHAYPDAAIMYYMTESIITFFSKRQVKPNHRSYEYDECLNFSMKSVSIINDIIDKYYDGKSEEYKKTMDEYELSRKEIFITKEPIRDNSVNVFLNIYSAAAADAAAVAAENKKIETDRNDKQKDKSNTDKPRSLSPQL